MNEIKTICNVSCYEKDGVAWLNLEAVARGLGFTQPQNKGGTEYTSIRWETVNRYDEPNLFVSVNGYNCLLPKGKTSLVPKSVADEINRARRAQQRLDATIDALKEAAEQQHK